MICFTALAGALKIIMLLTSRLRDLCTIPLCDMRPPKKLVSSLKFWAPIAVSKFLGFKIMQGGILCLKTFG